MNYFDQREFELKCEWGAAGLQQLLPYSDVVIIVDVLSFSTCVDIAVSQGAQVFPFGLRDDSVLDFSRSVGAIAATPGEHNPHGYWLSPSALQSVPAGTRLTLPSPNGATLSMMTGETPAFTACLRNAAAVAKAAAEIGPRISLIPAGERWPDGSLRPALEDWLGVGAVLSELSGRPSPEAETAVAAFRSFRARLPETLLACSSGKELVGRDRRRDVELAAQLNVSSCVPRLRNGGYDSG